MATESDVDLFPWIVGALLIVAAIPAVLALTGTPAQSSSTAATTPTLPVTAAMAPAAAPPPAATAMASQTPALPAGQVWQCVVNGQQVFSDSSCGAGASIRQLSVVNGMDPGSSAKGYRYPPTNGPAPSYDPDSSEDAQSDAVYGSTQYTVIEERRRHEHRLPSHPQFHAPVHGHSTH